LRLALVLLQCSVDLHRRSLLLTIQLLLVLLILLVRWLL
jgi:hypothetical protein